MAEININTSKKFSNNKISLIFLGIVLVLTISLYFYNGFVKSSIDKIQTNIDSINKNIEEIQQDKGLQIYSLLEMNKDVIDSYKKMNNVVTYINHMNVISGKYGVNYLGFDFSKGVITSSVTITSDTNSIAYQQTRDFISKYRVDEKALFLLEPITSIEGMDELKFDVKFKVK